jgi:hypothetical protein
VKLLLNKISVLVTVGLFGLGAGLLHAQDAQDPDDGGEPDVTVPMEKQAQLSPADMSEEGVRLVRSMQESLKKVVGLQQVARKQKDVIKLNCVNDKLLQIKQLLNIAESATTNMVEAIAQDDEPGRYHEFNKIVIAQQQVQVLAGEAETCIGEELVFIGPTEVEVDEPALPDDPTGPDSEFDIEDPGYASPFS